MIFWTCGQCGAAVPQDCPVCPGCGFDPDQPAATPASGISSLQCLRCDSPMQFAGTLKLHEGTRMWPVLLGNLGELLVDRKAFNTHVCVSCGKVEFFVPPPPPDDGRP